MIAGERAGAGAGAGEEMNYVGTFASFRMGVLEAHNISNDLSGCAVPIRIRKFDHRSVVRFFL